MMIWLCFFRAHDKNDVTGNIVKKYTCIIKAGRKCRAVNVLLLEIMPIHVFVSAGDFQISWLILGRLSFNMFSVFMRCMSMLVVGRR